jgi:signal transduction histidine kinase
VVGEGAPGNVAGHDPRLPGPVRAVSPLISLDRGAAISLAIVVVPVSIGIAMVRSHLFDIDRLINRTLVYGGLTGIVAGGYILIVGALGALFQTRGSLVISLIGAGVVAAVFQPLRMALQQAVDRMLFGERDDPYAVVARLGRSLEATVAPEALLPTIVETVAQTLKLPAVAIAVSDGDQMRPAATYGTYAGTPVAFPLTYHREVIGQLLVTPRALDEPLTSGDLLLLSDLARHASIAVHATRLTTDLQHSRARLVTAREEERRRLRRDLHDGLGPTLAGLTLKVGAIRNLLTHDIIMADRLLTELTAEIEAAMAEIRRLVYVLRPPSLDEHGLVAALRAYAARYTLLEATEPSTNQTLGALRVVVEAPEVVPPLPAAVEVAAFRIASEALANVARHARAHNCCVMLSVDDALHLEITDDGVGLAPNRRVGVGLVSMRERAEELGGTCEVVATPGGGTRVRAKLPLAKE